jgi:hypothetical protein
MQSREKVMDLLLKLRAMADETSSKSPAEAAIAAAQMQKLMFEHKIAAAELEVDDATLHKAEARVSKENLIGRDHDVVSWKLDLLAAVARNNFCRVVYTAARRRKEGWFETPQGRRYLVVPAKSGAIELFGVQADIDTVKYLYQYLMNEIERLAKVHVDDGLLAAQADQQLKVAEIMEQLEYGDISEYRAHSMVNALKAPSKRSWLNSFRNGCVTTISSRLREQRKASEAAFASTSCTALVRKADAAVDTFVEQTYPKLTSGRTTQVSDYSGFAAGREAGQGISLGGSKGSLGAPAPQLKGRT